MYWHRLLEEYINRYAAGMSYYYLPPIDDPASQDYPPRAQGESPQPRLYLDNGEYLTHREAECARLLLQGWSMKMTAEHLTLSPRTVEYYLKRLKERWGCNNKKELIVKLQEHGFAPTTRQQKFNAPMTTSN